MASDSLTYTTKAIVPAWSSYPTLRTANPKLWLRPFANTDLNAFYKIRQQVEVMKWTSKARIDANLEETQIWMNRFLETKPDTDASGTESTPEILDPAYYGFVVVYDEEDGSSRVVGTIGMLNLNEEAAIGYMFDKNEWGKGFATATVQALLDSWDHLDRRTVKVPNGKVERFRNILSMAGENAVGNPASPLPEILHAVTEGTNAASARILEKMGFKLERTYTAIEDGVEVPLKDWFRVRHVMPDS